MLGNPSWAKILQGVRKCRGTSRCLKIRMLPFVIKRKGIREKGTMEKKTCECLPCVENKDAILPLQLKPVTGWIL